MRSFDAPPLFGIAFSKAHYAEKSNNFVLSDNFPGCNHQNYKV